MDGFPIGQFQSNMDDGTGYPYGLETSIWQCIAIVGNPSKVSWLFV